MIVNIDKLVVDSSVVIQWFVPEIYSNNAQLILDEFENGLLDLLIPDLLYTEIGNIVWKKHRLQGLSAQDAESILHQVSAIPF